MNRRTFLKIGLMAGVGLMMPRSVFSETPPPPGLSGMKLLDHRPTVADRNAAALNARRMGMVPNAAGTGVINIPGVPHYFGPYANYANSPMPKGPITAITLDDPGSGYTAIPLVTIDDVYGTGYGATATATIANGVVTGITLDTPGFDYTAPVVMVAASGSGVTALASAVIGVGLKGGIPKFVDSLAGLGPTGINNLGSYISVGVPEQVTCASYAAPLDVSDYYEIAIVEYEQKFHTSLPATRLRGYVQLATANNPAGATAHPLFYPDGVTPILRPNGGTQYVALDIPRYLGPIIVSSHGKPVRVKLVNLLPTGVDGELFIPVDETIMGAGEGPLDQIGNPGFKEKYTHNRATFHLHGGLTPWISDGTPHQWVTAQGEVSQYQQGVSTVNVPDMWYDTTSGDLLAVGPTGPIGSSNNPPQGSMTFYYTNEQSARLMFYHDHAFGITRLNVYVGEAAGYLLTDEVEQDLINGTNVSGVNPSLLAVLPSIGIPLVLQDKTFVDAATIRNQDPTWRWNLDANGNPQTGSLWVPSVYMPAQNPWDPTGANAFGRWQYGPWFWPPTTNIQFGLMPNEYANTAPWEPPMRPTMPNPSMGMEAFNDTPMVNGTIYPYVEVDAAVTRFRILSAANDRFFNLSFFVADPAVITDDGRINTEVRMVPAMATPGFPASWPADGRAGGVPDPVMAGPDWVMIGSEGGFLPEPVVIPAQPIAWNMNATAFNVGNVTSHSLLLGCAERADVLVDFTPYAGKTLILYNDAPAAFPALDPRYDYYTGTPDQTAAGGAPSTQPGFGPNTRTVMQIRVKGTGGAALSGVQVTNGGQDFINAPMVVFDNVLTDLTGAGAAATASCGIDHITVVNPGAGYTSAPSVVITSASGSGATATATIKNGRVTAITVTKVGSGYLTAPTITLTGGGTPTSDASASAALFVNAITLDTPGSGYTDLPLVSLIGGGGYGATAVAAFAPIAPALDLAQLQTVWKKSGSKRGVFERFQDPIIVPQAAYNSAYDTTSFPADNSQYVQLQDFSRTIFGDPILSPNAPLVSIAVINGGVGYPDNPTVTIGLPNAALVAAGGIGVQATATAVAVGGVLKSVTITNPGAGYTSAPTITIANGTGAVVSANELLLQPKAIHDEMGAAYDIEYGRMASMLGMELPKSNSLLQNLSLYGYSSPPVDILQDTTMVQLGSLSEGTQIWKITHNGVDTHPMHFHLANVQIINRVAWDNALLPPEPLELGWKETVRTNPLEHLIVAMRPVVPSLPFDVPNSVRLIDPTKPVGAPLMGGPNGFIDPMGNATIVLNHSINYGWEFVWHCHILSHEEMDMMHAMSFAVSPRAPINVGVTVRNDVNNPRRATVTWTNGAANATSFIVERSLSPDFTGVLTTFATAGLVTTVQDPDVPKNVPVYYRVKALNLVGDTVVYRAPAVGYPHTTVVSKPSAVVTVNPPVAEVPAAPSSITVTQPGQRGSRVIISWQDNASNETNFTIQRARVVGGVTQAWITLSTTINPRNGTGGVVTYNDNSTNQGTRYYYRVWATNAAGPSSPLVSNLFLTK